MTLKSVLAFRSAFRAEPEVSGESPATGIGVYGWRTPNLEGFELPASDEVVIALHLGGSRRVRALKAQNLSRSCSVPGLVTVLPAGRSAAFRTDGSVSLVSLHVPKTTRDAAEMTVPRFAFRDAFVTAAMEILLSTAQKGGDRTNSAYSAKVADALLCHLAQHAGQPTAVPPYPSGSSARLGAVSVKELLSYVDAHVGTNLNLDEMARRACISRGAFTRRFRSVVGRSPHQYLIFRRVELAQQMLRETSLDLAFIAQELGFSSQSHFTAVFRSCLGRTPSSYRLQ